MTKIGSLAFGILVLFFSNFAHGAEAVATVNGQKDGEVEVVMGQSILYSVAVSSSESGGVGEPRLPDISGFNLIDRGTQVESRSEFVNGKFSFIRRQVFNYRLVPEAPGEFLLTPAEVVVGSETVRSNSVKIKVIQSSGNVRPSQPQAPQPDIQDDAQDLLDEADAIFSQLLQRAVPRAQQVPSNVNPDEAFFLRVEVDKDKVYVGEQITASWYLYTQNNLTNFEPIQYPTLRGFWKEDIEIATRLNFTNVVINGMPYRKALLVSYALFPIKAGTATIDSYKMRATAIMSNAFGVFGRPYTFTKVNPPVKVQVLPIPTQNQPSDYLGAVGNFDIKASVDRTTVAANEPFSFKIKFQGRGNAKQIELPALNLPDGFEQYDTKTDSKFSKDGTSYKEFEILLIPRQVGELTIPAVTGSFFNPKTQQFEKRTTQSIAMNVVAGKNNLPQGGSQGLNLTGQQRVKKVLPDPVFVDSSFVIDQQTLNKTWWGLTAISVLFLFAYFLKVSRTSEKRVALIQHLNKRAVQIQKLQDAKKFREASVAVVNLVQFVLAEITMDKESHQLEQLEEKLPPSVKTVLDEKYRENIKYFETVGFAPEAITASLSDDKRFKSEMKSLKSYLVRAIEAFQQKT